MTSQMGAVKIDDSGERMARLGPTGSGTPPKPSLDELEYLAAMRLEARELIENAQRIRQDRERLHSFDWRRRQFVRVVLPVVFALMAMVLFLVGTFMLHDEGDSTTKTLLLIIAAIPMTLASLLQISFVRRSNRNASEDEVDAILGETKSRLSGADGDA